jgi:SAM-dependent methyltransferase
MRTQFVDIQRRYWQDADPAHFAWQTQCYSGTLESRLLGHIAARPGQRLLEIGCGEGGNLFNLRRLPVDRFGVDYSRAKAHFARAASAALTAVADAARLPFADDSFDFVLIRDVLHHVPNPTGVVAEARRVLARGGRLVVIEPNARSPLILLHAALVPAERGVLRSRAEALRAQLLAAPLEIVVEERLWPLPIERVLLNPKFGLPALGRRPLVQRMLGFIDALARRVLPSAAWGYLRFEAIKPVQGAAT